MIDLLAVLWQSCSGIFLLLLLLEMPWFLSNLTALRLDPSELLVVFGPKILMLGIDPMA